MPDRLILLEYWYQFLGPHFAYLLAGIGLYVVVMSLFAKRRTASALAISALTDWLGLTALLSLLAFIYWSATRENFDSLMSFSNLWLSSTLALIPLLLAAGLKTQSSKGTSRRTAILFTAIAASPLLAIGVTLFIHACHGFLPVWKSFLS